MAYAATTNSQDRADHASSSHDARASPVPTIAISTACRCATRPYAAAMTMLAAVDFRNPLFWAVFIGWIMSVVLHEFAHGIVAYWGGDYTIRERGGLTLNPLQYIDPVGSILLPILFLLMGGVPLPGGSTYIRRDLLRSRAWEAAVSLAGPAMNFLLFLACAIPLHPESAGWIRRATRRWTPAQRLLATMAVLQGIVGRPQPGARPAAGRVPGDRRRTWTRRRGRS